MRAAEMQMRAELAAIAEESDEENASGRFVGPGHPGLRLLRFRVELTRLSKEFSGMSVSDLADKVKGERILPQMRVAMANFMRQCVGVGGSRRVDRGENKMPNRWRRDDEGWELYRLLRKVRKPPTYHRTLWAQCYGYPSYYRFFRACLLCYGKTPQQMELEILEEYAEYYAAARELKQRVRWKQGFNSERLKELEENDSWAKAAQERPEWLAAMRKEFGLEDALCNVLSEVSG